MGDISVGRGRAAARLWSLLMTTRLILVFQGPYLSSPFAPNFLIICPLSVCPTFSWLSHVPSRLVGCYTSLYVSVGCYTSLHVSIGCYTFSTFQSVVTHPSRFRSAVTRSFRFSRLLHVPVRFSRLHHVSTFQSTISRSHVRSTFTPRCIFVIQ